MAGGRDYLNGRVDASTEAGALSSSSTLKRCVDHDPNRASRWTWRTLRATACVRLAVAVPQVLTRDLSPTALGVRLWPDSEAPAPAGGSAYGGRSAVPTK